MDQIKHKIIKDIYICGKLILNRNLYNKKTRDDTQRHIPYLYPDTPWLLRTQIKVLKEVRNRMQISALYLIKGQFE